MKTENKRTVSDALNIIDTRVSRLIHLLRVIVDASMGRTNDPAEAINEIGFLLMIAEDEVSFLRDEVDAAEQARLAEARETE